MDDYLGALPSPPFQILFNEKDTYELGALKWALDHTEFTDFMLLHSSTEVKDLGFLISLFGEKSVCITERLGSYMGIYKREILEQMQIPNTPTKSSSVTEEGSFTAQYIIKAPHMVIDAPEILPMRSEKYVEKFGRNNMVIENNYLIKYKGCWAPDMIKETS
jgi:hypothetical protein